jgi:hypothetical protein
MELQYFIGKYITHAQEKEKTDVYFRFVNCNDKLIHIKFNNYIYGLSQTDNKSMQLIMKCNDVSDWYMLPYVDIFTYISCVNDQSNEEPFKIIKYIEKDKVNIIIGFFGKITGNIHSILSKNSITANNKDEYHGDMIEFYKECYFLFRDRINGVRRYLTYKTTKNKKTYDCDYQILLSALKTNSEIAFKLHHLNVTLLSPNDSETNMVISDLKKIASVSQIKIENLRFQKIMIDRIQLNLKYIDKLSNDTKYFSKNNDLQTLISKYENKTEPNMSQSLDLYSDIILMSDWCEELLNNNIMGLLIKISSLDLSKMGYDIRKTSIHEITTTFTSYQQLLYAYDNFYSSNHKYDNGLNMQSTIHGDGIGNGNVIIPLYIHKVHWELVKIYMNTILGISFCQHPLSFTSNHINIFFLLFSTMNNLTFCKEYHSEKWIKIFISLYRTCYQILKDNKTNIRHKIDTFCDIIENRSSNEYLPLYCFFSQILCSDYINYRFDDIIQCVIEEGIRHCCSNIFKNVANLNYIFNFNTVNDIDEYNQQIEMDNYSNIEYFLNKDQINNVVIDFQSDKTVQMFLGNIISYYRFHKVMQKYISTFNSIPSFINTIDKYYGVLPDKDILCFKNELNIFDKISNNTVINGILDDSFNHHTCKSTEEIIEFKTIFSKCNIEYDEMVLYALLIQGIIQRNDRKRIMAIQKNKYTNPFKFPLKTIGKCGLLIAKNKYKILVAK